MSSTCVFACKLLTQDEGQSIETEVPEFGVVMASGSNQSAFDRVQGELGIDNWSIKGMEFTAHEGRVLHGQGSLPPSRTAMRITCTQRSIPVEYPLVPQEQAVDLGGRLARPRR